MTDLWSPSPDFRKPAGVPMERISEEALNSPAITEYPAYKAPMGRSMALLGKLGLPPKSALSEGVAIPEVRQIPDYASGWDDSITTQFQAAFKHGYISMREAESSSLQSSSTPIQSPLKRSRSRSSRRSVLKPSPAPSPISVSASSSSAAGRRGRSANKKSSVPRTPVRLVAPPTEEAPSPAHVRPTKSSRLWQHFHPTRWTQVEIEFAQVLHEIFGSDWPAISRYMCRTKSPVTLERAFKRCDGDFKKIEATTFDHLKCEVCKTEARLAEAVFCDSCYRSYHLRCTYPVLDAIPETDWFCSSHCSKLGTLNCKTCRKATDDNLILVCDKCERGAHMYCLAEPLKEIPEGEWFCDECASTATPRSSATSHSKQSTSHPRVTARTASRANDVIQASKECSHEHGLRIAPSSGPNSAHSSARRSSSSSTSSTSSTQTSGPAPAISSSNNSLTASGASAIPTHTHPHFTEINIATPPVSQLAYLLLSYAVDVPWKELVHLSQLCVDCIIEQDGGVVPSKLGDFVTGHALLPQSFRHSIFVNQVDDIPFTTSGDLPDPAALNAHLDTLLMAADAAVNRSITKPLLAHPPPHGYAPPPAPSLSVPTTRTSNARNVTRFTLPSRSSPNVDRPLRSAGHTSTPLPDPRRRAAVTPSANALATRVRSPSAGRIARKNARAASNVTLAEWLIEGGYNTGDHCYWIFQANPGFYDINNSLKHLSHMTWVVRQNQSRIRRGDRVFVWESGKDSGMIALGTILSNPCVSRESPSMRPFAKDPAKFDRPDVRCEIEIEHVLPAKLRRADIASEAGLINLTILRAPIGTNFKVTKAEAGCIMNRLTSMHPSNVFKSSPIRADAISIIDPNAVVPAPAPITSDSPVRSRRTEALTATPLAATTRAAAKRTSAPGTPLSKSLNVSSSSVNGSSPVPSITGSAMAVSTVPILANGKHHAADEKTSSDASTADESTSEELPSSNGIATIATPTSDASKARNVANASSAPNGTNATAPAPNGHIDELGESTDESNGSTAMDVDEDTSILVKVKADIVRSMGPEGLDAFRSYDDEADSEYIVNSSMDVSDIEVSEDESTDDESEEQIEGASAVAPAANNSSIATDDSDSYDEVENGESGVATDDEEEEEGYDEDVDEEEGAETDDEEEDDEQDTDDEDDEAAADEEDEEANLSRVTPDEEAEEDEEDDTTNDSDSSASPNANNGSAMDLDSDAPSADQEVSTKAKNGNGNGASISNGATAAGVASKAPASANGYGSDSDGGASDVPTDSDEDDDGDDDDGEYVRRFGPSELNAAGLTRNRQKLLEVNDPSLAMRFPLKMVQTAVINSRRMRLSVHVGSSVLIAVSGGRELKKKSTGKIPLVPVTHAHAVHTFIAKTPAGWKFKLAPVPEDDIPQCPACSIPLMKSPVVSCNTCGRSNHVHCAMRIKGGGASSSALNASAHLSQSNNLMLNVGTPLAHAADFTCSVCTHHHADNSGCGKCRRVVRTDYFSCDACDDPYHLSCLGLKQAPRDGPWLCHKCDIPKSALMRLKLAFVLRELRLEVLRLTTACVDIGAARLRRCIESPDKAGSPINTLGNITDAARHGCATIAQQALERWNLYRTTAKIDFVE